MKSEINPTVAIVVIAVVVIGVVVFFAMKAQGPTFSKSDARGRMEMPVGKPGGR